MIGGLIFQILAFLLFSSQYKSWNAGDGDEIGECNDML